MPFDPYQQWLGIPPVDQPPTHYRLLGIEPHENDPEVIAMAGSRQAAVVRSLRTARELAIAQKLLMHIELAKDTLLDPERRAAYDKELFGSQRNKIPSVQPIPQSPSSPVHAPSENQVDKEPLTETGSSPPRRSVRPTLPPRDPKLPGQDSARLPSPKPMAAAEFQHSSCASVAGNYTSVNARRWHKRGLRAIAGAACIATASAVLVIALSVAPRVLRFLDDFRPPTGKQTGSSETPHTVNALSEPTTRSALAESPQAESSIGSAAGPAQQTTTTPRLPAAVSTVSSTATATGIRPSEVTDAWRRAGAKYYWVRSPAISPPLPLTISAGRQPDDIPVFHFEATPAASIAALPRPNVPIGIWFAGGQIGDQELKESSQATDLRMLMLHKASVSDEGLKEIARQARLEALSLAGSPITDAGLAHLQSLSQLKFLSLDSTKITDAGLKQLASLKQLRWLYLSSTSVSDAGLKDLADLERLRSLHLNFTHVTNDGLRWLVNCRQLESLELRGTAISEAGVRQLSAPAQLQYVTLGSGKTLRAGTDEFRVALGIASNGAIATVGRPTPPLRPLAAAPVPGPAGAGRLPMPNEADQQTARTKIVSLHSINTTKSDRKAMLQHNLLSQARVERDEVRRYVLFDEARKAASESQNIGAAKDIIREMERLYDIDVHQLQGRNIIDWLPWVRTSSDQRRLAQEAILVIGELVKEGRIGLATELQGIANNLAMASNDTALADMVRQSADELLAAQPSRVPNPAAIEQAQKDLALTAAERAMTSDLTIRATREMDAARRYVLFEQARAAALNAGDITNALNVLRRMAAHFEINLRERERDALTDVARRAVTNPIQTAVVTEAIQIVDQLIVERNFGLADEVQRIAEGVAERSKNNVLRSRASSSASKLQMAKQLL